MDSPLLNFVAAVGIGVVIGVIGAFVLRSQRPAAMRLAPVLALAGSLLASVAALLVGDDRDYGWKEPILQVILALAGVGVAYFMSADKGKAAGAS
jgi:CHASE2 domain-containing sensor protein